MLGQSFATDHVNGYTRSDGTRVQGHSRSDANSTKMDNYSKHQPKKQLTL